MGAGYEVGMILKIEHPVVFKHHSANVPPTQVSEVTSVELVTDRFQGSI